MVYNIFVFTVLLVFSAFFSASETAIFSLSKVSLRSLREKNPRAKIIKNLLQKPTRLLSAIVFGNLLFNIGISALATSIFVSAWGPGGLLFAVLFSGFTILFLGEVFPKIFAVYSARRFSLPAASVLAVFIKIFLPLILMVEKIVNYFSKKMLRAPKKKISQQEFKTALLLGKKSGYVSEAEREMISYILEFKDTTAGEIATARVDMKGVRLNFSQEEVLSFLRKVKHSKLPVYQDSLDRIRGVIYAKDIFLNPGKNWQSFIKEPIFIPESKGIDDILKLFREKKSNIAIVLDEHGGTEGMVTLEDVVEEIFGEIYDEFEKNEEPVEKTGDNSWRVYGKTPVKTVNIELDLDIPEEEDNVAGFLLAQIERIPRPGEKFIFDFFRDSSKEQRRVEFDIERATARRIVSVLVRVSDLLA